MCWVRFSSRRARLLLRLDKRGQRAMINPLVYFLLFFKASLFSSGGFSNLPSLHQDLIANGWATEADFGQSIAIGQISPGPNGLWVISMGYLTYGVLGASLALIAITLPAVLVLAISAGYKRIERHAWVQGAMHGVSLAVFGLLLTLVWTLHMVEPSPCVWLPNCLSVLPAPPIRFRLSSAYPLTFSFFSITI